MILLTVILYDVAAVIITITALLCAHANSMIGLLICGIASAIAMFSIGWVLANYE